MSNNAKKSQSFFNNFFTELQQIDLSCNTCTEKKFENELH